MPDEIPELSVTVPSDQQVGAYANFATVSSQTPHDVTLDFIQMVPGPGTPQAVVVARIKLATTFLMPLMQALASHAGLHEDLLRKAAGPPTHPPPDAEEMP